MSGISPGIISLLPSDIQDFAFAVNAELIAGTGAVFSDVPFNASDYTAKAAMTWTVTNHSSRICKENKLVHWWLGIGPSESSIGGVLSNQLFIKLPPGLALARPIYSTLAMGTTSAGGSFPEVEFVNFGDPDNTHLSIVRGPAFANFIAGSFAFQFNPITFEIV